MNIKSSIITSDNLPLMRRLIADIKPLKQLIGDIAQFILVVDTNIILGDLIWLTKKRTNPESKTQIQECIIAGTFITYCTKTVVKEVNNKLVIIANERNIPLESLKKEWRSYKSLLKIKEPSKDLIDKYKNGIDPDDAPTVALSKSLSAYIISKDPHIKAMGGKVLPVSEMNNGVMSIEFCATARDYSRKATVSISIKIAGYYTLTLSVQLLAMLTDILKIIARLIGKLPDWAKLLFVAAALYVFFIPKFRDFIINLVKTIISGLQKATPQILCVFEEIITLLAENEPIVPIIQK